MRIYDTSVDAVDQTHGDNDEMMISGGRGMKPILPLAAMVKAESEQRTYPSTPRMANMALFR